MNLATPFALVYSHFYNDLNLFMIKNEYHYIDFRKESYHQVVAEIISEGADTFKIEEGATVHSAITNIAAEWNLVVEYSIRGQDNTLLFCSTKKQSMFAQGGIIGGVRL